MYVYMLFGYHAIEKRWIFLNQSPSEQEMTYWYEDLNCPKPILGDVSDHLSQVWVRKKGAAH